MNESDSDVRKKFYAKLLAVQKAVKPIRKDGRVSFKGVNYKYASDEEVVMHLRNLLIDAGLLVITYVYKQDFHKMDTFNADGVVTRQSILSDITLMARVHDVDTGYSEEFAYSGHGIGSDDKSPYKATTGARKYALMNILLIPTSDDPEKYDNEGKKSDGAADAMEGYKNAPLAHARAEQAKKLTKGEVCLMISKLEGEAHGTPQECDNSRMKWLDTVELKDAPKEKLKAYYKHLKEKKEGKNV